MKIERIIGAKCPQTEESPPGETVRTYVEYSYIILDPPVSEAELNSAMCNITPETLAYDLNLIVYKISGIKELARRRLSPTERIRILTSIKEYANEIRWTFGCDNGCLIIHNAQDILL